MLHDQRLCPYLAVSSLKFLAEWRRVSCLWFCWKADVPPRQVAGRPVGSRRRLRVRPSCPSNFLKHRNASSNARLGLPSWTMFRWRCVRHPYSQMIPTGIRPLRAGRHHLRMDLRESWQEICRFQGLSGLVKQDQIKRSLGNTLVVG